jgi:hypothetical protein
MQVDPQEFGQRFSFSHTNVNKTLLGNSCDSERMVTKVSCRLP